MKNNQVFRLLCLCLVFGCFICCNGIFDSVETGTDGEGDSKRGCLTPPDKRIFDLPAEDSFSPKDPLCENVSDEKKCACLQGNRIDNQYIIYFDDKVDCSERESWIEVLKKSGDKVLRQYGCNEIVLMEIPPEVVEPSERIAKAESEIEGSGSGSIGGNYKLVLGQINPTLPTNLSRYELPQEDRVTSHQVLIGIVDMGLQFDHPSIDDNNWQNPDWQTSCLKKDRVSWNFKVNNAEDIFDLTGHGTHIGGIILNNYQRPNPAISDFKENEKKRLALMSLKITREKSKQTDLFSASCAIKYAIDHDVNILNISWGYYAEQPDPAFRELLLKAKSKNILVISSAGNDSMNIDDCKHWPASFAADSELDHVIAVAALSEDTEALAEYTNYGNSVLFAAPGTDIFSSIPEDTCGKSTGTSMATPFVTRLAALVMLRQPGLKDSYLAAKAELSSFLVPIQVVRPGQLPDQRIPFDGLLGCP